MTELLTLFLIFLRISLMGFGGGYAMLTLIFQSVQNFGILSLDDFADMVALSQITPGPVAVNAAAFVGFTVAGLPGAIFSALGIIIPSFILIYIVAHFLDRFKESTIIEEAFTGIRPTSVGLIGAAFIYICAISVFNDSFTFENIARMGYHYIEPVGLIILVIAIIANGKFRVNPLLITIAGGVAGVFLLG